MNAEQKQLALQMLRKFEQAVPMTRQAENAAVTMAAILQELVDAKEPEPVGEAVDFNGWRIVRWKGEESSFPLGTKFYTAPPAPSVPVLTVECEPDYWSGGHYHEGTKPHIDPTAVWKLPIGTELYTSPPAPSVPDGWQPIETAPKDNKRSLFLACFNDDGTMQAFDYDGTWQSERESWELPQVYYYWATALGNVEEPTHWMYEPEWFSKLNSAQQPAPSVPDEQLQAAFDRGLKAGNEQAIAQQIEIHKLHDLLAVQHPEQSNDQVRDAERYRWLRTYNTAKHPAVTEAFFLGDENLDAEIDAAIAAKKGGADRKNGFAAGISAMKVIEEVKGKK